MNIYICFTVSGSHLVRAYYFIPSLLINIRIDFFPTNLKYVITYEKTEFQGTC